MDQCSVEASKEFRQNTRTQSIMIDPKLTQDEVQQKTQVMLNDFVNIHKTESIYNYYTIIQPLIGKGYYSDIRKGVHKTLGVTRAIKIISTSQATPQEIERVLNEIEILMMMDHPNVLKIIEVFQSPKDIQIVTELYPGGELFDHFADFSERDVVRIIKQVLQGLNYCHQHKIIHRDIRPKNIIFEIKDKQGSIKIIDFGSSQVFDPHQKMNEQFGAVYLKVLKNKYDGKCDLWSCGVITYELLCGYPPFNGITESKTLKKVEKGEYNFDSAFWETITEEAKDFISKLMEIDPQKRLSASQALQHPWLQKLDDDSNEMPQLDGALGNMNIFKITKQLQRAIQTYIVNQFLNVEKQSKLLKTFNALDTNNDGCLSKDELLVGLKKVMGEKEAEYHSSDIEFTEFTVFTIYRKKLLFQDNLQKTFKAIDQNGNGSISIDQLKLIFGNGQIPDEILQQIMLEINEKEEISFSDFLELMLKLKF